MWTAASSSISSIAGANTVGTAKQWLRFRLVGQSLYVRVWADGTAEPATWTYSTTDSSVTTAGQTSLSLIRAGANTGAKSIAIDDLTLSGDTAPAPVDNVAPSTPGGLAATTTSTSVSLSWSASTDNVAVTGYEVRRNGTLITTTGAGVLTFTDAGRTPDTTYAYTVTAVDAAGNASAPASRSATTDAVSGSLFSDTWTAANGSPWSSSWTTSVSNGTADTQGSAGQLAITDVSNAFARAQLTGSAAVADSDLLFSYRWSSGAPRAYFTVYQRGSGGWQNAYRPRTGYGLQIQSDSGNVVLQKNVDGTVTTVSSLAGANQVGHRQAVGPVPHRGPVVVRAHLGRRCRRARHVDLHRHRCERERGRADVLLAQPLGLERRRQGARHRRPHALAGDGSVSLVVD